MGNSWKRLQTMKDKILDISTFILLILMVVALLAGSMFPAIAIPAAITGGSAFLGIAGIITFNQ